jgi:hypothetical protein
MCLFQAQYFSAGPGVYTFFTLPPLKQRSRNSDWPRGGHMTMSRPFKVGGMAGIMHPVAERRLTQPHKERSSY